jgi:hypothetical protein
MKLDSKRDAISGLFFIIVGAGFLYASSHYQLGTASRMGPGYFPSLLSIVMIAIGCAITISGWRNASDSADDTLPLNLRGGAIIIGSVVLFAIILPRGGLLAAIFVLVVTSSVAAGRGFHWQTIVLAAALTVFSAVVFVKLLGLPVPLWPAI